jgi:hypothetical protein
MNIMDYEMRQRKKIFTKEWPVDFDPPMTAYPYFNRRFEGIDGYNWWLLPSVENGVPKYWGYCRDASITMKFIHKGSHVCSFRSDSWERIAVLVKTDDTVYQLYVDEDGYLFGNITSETTVGYLSQIHKMWDGTAEINVNAIQEHHPFADIQFKHESL